MNDSKVALRTAADVQQFLDWLVNNHPEVYQQYAVVDRAKRRLTNVNQQYKWNGTEPCKNCGTTEQPNFEHSHQNHTVAVKCSVCGCLYVTINEWQMLDQEEVSRV